MTPGRSLVFTSSMALLGLTSCAVDPLACGEGTERVGDLCVPLPGSSAEDSTRPAVQEVRLLELSIFDDDVPLRVHYPTEVAMTVEVTGEPASAALHLSLDLPDGSGGCTLGHLTVDHVPPRDADGHYDISAPATWHLTGRVIPYEECHEVAGRSDLVPRVSFDALEATDYAERELSALDLTREPSLWDITRTVPLDAASCADPNNPDGCFGARAIEASPGLGVELTQLALSSSVVVVPLSRHNHGDDEVPLSELPHLNATASVMTWGLPSFADHDPDALHLTAWLRPAPGAPGTAGLGAADLDFQPLHLRTQLDEDDATHELTDRRSFGGSSHQTPHHVVLDLELAGETLDRVDAGLWTEVEEFVVEICAGATEPQADLGGDELLDDCLRAPVLLLRRATTGDAPGSLLSTDGSTAPAPSGGGSQERDPAEGVHEAYGHHWGIAAGDPATAAFTAGAGWSMGTSLGLAEHSIIGRVPFERASGGWVGAGAWAEAVIWHIPITFFEVGAYFLDYTRLDEGPEVPDDRFHLRATLFGRDYIPRLPLGRGWPVPDATLTLEDLLNIIATAQGGSYSAEFSYEWVPPELGISFDVPCGRVEAGIGVVITAGLDEQGTQMSKEPLPSSAQTCAEKPVQGGTVQAASPWIAGNGAPKCDLLVQVDATHQEPGLAPGLVSLDGAAALCAGAHGNVSPHRPEQADEVAHAMWDHARETERLPQAWVNHSYEWAHYAPRTVCPHEDPTCWGPGSIDGRAHHPGNSADDWMFLPVDDALWADQGSGAELNPNNFSVLNGFHPKFEGEPGLQEATPDLGTEYFLCTVPTDHVSLIRTLGGTTLNTIVYPHVAAGARVGVSFEFDIKWLHLAVELSTTLNVIDLGFPALLYLSYEFMPDGGIQGTLAFELSYVLKQLSGNVHIGIDYRVAEIFTRHYAHDVVSWDGIVQRGAIVPRVITGFHAP